MKSNTKIKLNKFHIQNKDLTETWNNRYYPINNPSGSEIKSQNINTKQNKKEFPIINSTQSLNLVESKNFKNNKLNLEIINVENIWNDLGVSEDYREQFIMYIENLKVK